MVSKANLREIEDKVLNPLNEILLLSYGTELYRLILHKIEKTVYHLEKQKLIYRRWQ